MFGGVSKGLLGAKLHYCHRYPPSGITEVSSSSYDGKVARDTKTVFPIVGPDLWCGEFRTK